MTTSVASGVALYEIADMRDVLDTWLAETDGELTPELEALLAELAGKADEKIERVALYIRERLARAKAVKDEADRLTALAKANERAADSLKLYLKRQMERLGTTKVHGLLCDVAIQRNSQPTVTTALEPADLYQLDSARPFVIRAEVVQYRLDRDALLAAWKADANSVPAAIVVEQGTHVRIR